MLLGEYRLCLLKNILDYGLQKNITMATIKPFTDLKQSKILAEILPLESADMCYWKRTWKENDYAINVGHSKDLQEGFEAKGIEYVPCWSVAALLGVLPKIINNETLFIETSAALWHIGYRNIYTTRADNPVDACYEMIIRLHELNLL